MAYCAEARQAIGLGPDGVRSDGQHEYDGHFHDHIRTRRVTGYHGILAFLFSGNDVYFAKAREIVDVQTIGSLVTFDLQEAERMLERGPSLLLATYRFKTGTHSVVVGMDQNGLYKRDPGVPEIHSLKDLLSLGELCDGLVVRGKLVVSRVTAQPLGKQKRTK